MNTSISEYQKRCFLTYKDSINYPKSYTYLYGNPLNVAVPVETATNGYMVIGAYPSAKFYTIGGISDTPLYDNDSPFSSEKYFDGSRVRCIPSGEELNNVVLKRIGVNRAECWITDLVKVFLFKEGHIERYKKLNKTDIMENRSKFSEYAKLSIPWLEEEVFISKPKLTILLGTEVTGCLFNIPYSKAIGYLDGKLRELEIGTLKVRAIALPHPGILMKKTVRNPWPIKFEKGIAPTAMNSISITNKILQVITD